MITKDMQLTPHFKLGELVRSDSHPEAVQMPNEQQVENLRRVCAWLEQLRFRYNKLYPREDGLEEPVHINSGYRCPMLNAAVGGSPTSNHLTGCAVDIRCGDKDYYDRAKRAVRYATILIGIAHDEGWDFDEIIIERLGTSWWVHFAVKPAGNRNKVTCITG